ncbi:glycoside hydrolase family 25 protein [Mesorhizobium sp. Cs1299R1N3]|uniref:glycoside hydrolase family 25 protein n=1 Tax=Mesorhizobium sp. Cs1299R1N3 TaxID=3015173 RepID=UPI00301E418F
MRISRRTTLLGAAAVAASWAAPSARADAKLFNLVDDDTRGALGERDLLESGISEDHLRSAMADFIFPDNADDGKPYGIDVSHHTKNVPWADLHAVKCQYVYVKASQASRGVDERFVEHWKNATSIANVPVGAYHFLCPRIPGEDQAKFFLSRVVQVDGVADGNLQPVVDLEWDTYGPDFKRVVSGYDKKKRPIYKDYWLDEKPSDIVAVVQGFVDQLRAQVGSHIVPRIYTNRTWWHSVLGDKVRFNDCKIWISDYRKASFDSQQPQSVVGHEYDLWQFSETGRIRASKGPLVGPFDCNKLSRGALSDLIISQ